MAARHNMFNKGIKDVRHSTSMTDIVINVPESPKEESVESQLKSITEFVNAIKSDCNKLNQKLKQLDKTIKQEKKKTKQETKTPKKKPSGFAIAGSVTPELCAFMEEETGTKLARTSVTKALIKYIKANSLENPSDRRLIIPDDKLNTLLDLKPDDKVTYFNLQSYINHHFVDKIV